MTQATTNFLALVNKAIDESGSELATFGADFTTNTDPQMNRFKGWVVRAWSDIQQESFDWQWMSEQGVVTAKPGIMFYSDTSIGAATTFINPAVILDVNGTIIQSNLIASEIRSLTTRFQTPKPFGSMSLLYADYSLTNSHRLDFGLKAGGETITRTGLNKSVIRFTYSLLNTVDFLAHVNVGDGVTSLTALNNTAVTSTTVNLLNGSVLAIATAGNIVTVDVQYDSFVSGDFLNQMRTYAAAQASVNTVNIGFRINFTSGYTATGAIVWPPGLNATGPTSSITPFNYTVEFDGWVQNAGSTIPGPFTSSEIFLISGLGSNSYILTMDATASSIYNDNAIGSLKVTINTETGLAGNGYPMSTWTALLFNAAPQNATHYLTPYVFYPDRASDINTKTNVIFWDGASNVTTVLFSYFVPYLATNWIHSWKSYDWNEEFDTNDFIAATNIREINQSSYKIVYHDDPVLAGSAPLKFVPWPTFNDLYSYATTVPGTPRIITEDNMGRWRFYPPLDRPYTILFDYVREPMTLVNATDIPRGLPQEYVDMIMWKALIYYGEYDEDSSVVARATKNYMNLLTRFAQQTRPKFYFKSGFRSI